MLTYDAFEETVVHKFSSNGTELWTETVPDELAGIWAATDGGAYVHTRSFYDRDGHAHRLGPDGAFLSVSPPKERFFEIIAPAADGSGFFAVHDGALIRTDPELDTIWSTDIEQTSTVVFASAVADDEQTFAFASAETDNYWISVLAKP